MSSYDIIRKLKKLHTFTKIGYIGTLDRNATGILPVAINEAVKLIPFLENVEKAYRARFLLGVTTDTLDIEGKVLTETEVPSFERPYLEELLQGFVGKITQRVPLYSSKKVNKKPLYKWARKGIPVEAPEKEVEIFNITFLNYDHPYVDIEVSCSKGTYIRTLANDFGSKLGCGATLYSLKRTRHGEFSEGMGIDIEPFERDSDIINSLLSLENVLQSVRGVVVETALERFMKQGMPVPIAGNTKDWKDGEATRLLNKKGVLIGIGIADITTKTIKIKRLINH